MAFAFCSRVALPRSVLFGRWQSNSVGSFRGKRRRVLFFGSDQLSVNCFRALLKEKENADGAISHVEVICPGDSMQKGKQKLLQVPLKAAAIEEKTVVHEVPSSLKSLKSFRPETIEPGKFDLGVVVSFGYFIPEHILNLFPDGAINVHPSLLPKYRGPAPIYHTILNKDAETGVSIIEVDRKAFDVGDILAQKSIKIDPNAKYNQLLKSLSDVSCQLLVDSLRSLDLLRSSREIQPTQNHTAEFARAPKVTTEMGALMWNSDEFLDIYARYKAFSENMGVFTHFQGKRIKIIEMIPASPEAELDNTLSKLGPGHILYWSRTKQLFVVTKDKKCFQLIQLQVEGRKALSAVEFANGFRLSASTPVCFQDI